MNERIKTILLILFIAGVIGAFNAIIGLSQSTGTSPLQTIGQALGLVQKPVPEPGRKFDFIAGELSKGQPAGTAPISSTNPPTVTGSATTTPTPTPKATATPQPVQTTNSLPKLPPLPPVGGNVKGTKTSLPPLPPIRGAKTLGVATATKLRIPPLPPVKSKTLGTKTTSLESEIQEFFQSAASFFGF